MEKLTFFGKLKKSGDKLVYISESHNKQYEEFKKNLPEGAIVELFAEIVNDNGNLAQLAKVHAMIRELSKHTGYTFEELKLLVKDQAGLCLTRTVAEKEYFYCKSFGDCDIHELSAAIKACQEIGETVGHPIQ